MIPTHFLWHSGWVDLCDHPKCGPLGGAIMLRFLVEFFYLMSYREEKLAFYTANNYLQISPVAWYQGIGVSVRTVWAFLTRTSTMTVMGFIVMLLKQQHAMSQFTCYNDEWLCQAKILPFKQCEKNSLTSFWKKDKTSALKLKAT